MVAARSVTSKIAISSNSIPRGNISGRVCEDEIIPPPDISSIIIEPEKPTIPMTMTKAATIPPKTILRFINFFLATHILNVETKNAYSDFTKFTVCNIFKR